MKRVQGLTCCDAACRCASLAWMCRAGTPVSMDPHAALHTCLDPCCTTAPLLLQPMPETLTAPLPACLPLPLVHLPLLPVSSNAYAVLVEPAPPQVFLDKKGKKDPRVAAAVQAQAAAEVAAGTHVRILAIDGLQVTVRVGPWAGGGGQGCERCWGGLAWCSLLCVAAGVLRGGAAVLGRWAGLAKPGVAMRRLMLRPAAGL